MENDKLISSLKTFIGSCFDVFITLHGFHWNVEGDGFFDLHDFFQKGYEELHSDIDEFAERLRALSHYAPSSIKEMKDLSLIENVSDKNLTAHKMLEIFCENTAILVLQAKNMISLCDTCDDPVTQDMLIDFVQSQEKMLWMAKSYMKK